MSHNPNEIWFFQSQPSQRIEQLSILLYITPFLQSAGCLKCKTLFFFSEDTTIINFQWMFSYGYISFDNYKGMSCVTYHHRSLIKGVFNIGTCIDTICNMIILPFSINQITSFYTLKLQPRTDRHFLQHYIFLKLHKSLLS